MILQKTHRATPITAHGMHAAVDIVLPFYGQYDKVTRLLESLFRLTHRSNLYRICLVDDCSPNVDFGGYFLANIPGLKCIRTSTQKGFAGAMEEGFRQTENPWCLFMNSDCVLEDMGMIKNLIKTILRYKDQNVGMVAPRTNNPVSGDLRQKSDKLQIVQDHDVILNLDKDPDAYLSMHCFLAQREIFERVGGFVKNYPFGWYEDMEFAYRLRKYGYKQAIACGAWVYHEGFCTIKDLWRKNQEAKKIMEEDNYKRCQNDILELCK